MSQRQEPFQPSSYYHVYNRGHNKQVIFHDYKDYARYLKRLNEYLKKHEVGLLAYCLMPNHVHLLLYQKGEEPIDRFIHRLHTAYTMYFNKKYTCVGAVFQGRFKAKRIESEEYLLHVSRYIHINPLEMLRVQGRALNSQLERYPWSSYGDYIHFSDDRICDPSEILAYFPTNPMYGKTSYKSFVEDYLGIANEDRLSEISDGKL